ncbi:MAG: flagellar brake protein [bacterium]|nr:flagellar brake protein [bacterium]
MKHKAFLPNKKVSIRVVEGDYQGYYNSRIEGINDEEIVLALPFIGTIPVPVRIGEKISIYSVSDDAVYRVDGEIIKRQLEPIPLLQVKINKDIVRVQRRRYVRIPIVLNIQYKLKETDKIYYTYSKDISGGGIRIVLPEVLNIHSIVEVRIELPPPELSINCEGEIVWIDKQEIVVNNRKEEIIHAGIKFTLIEEKERERLIRFLFNYQRNLIKKGWKSD